MTTPSSAMSPLSILPLPPLKGIAVDELLEEGQSFAPIMASVEVLDDCGRHFSRILTLFTDEELEEELVSSRESELVGAADTVVQPIRELEEWLHNRGGRTHKLALTTRLCNQSESSRNPRNAFEPKTRARARS